MVPRKRARIQQGAAAHKLPAFPPKAAAPSVLFALFKLLRGLAHQVPHVDFQRFGQHDERAQTRLAFAVLDLVDVLDSPPRALGQLILRDPKTLPDTDKDLAEKVRCSLHIAKGYGEC